MHRPENQRERHCSACGAWGRAVALRKAVVAVRSLVELGAVLAAFVAVAQIAAAERVVAARAAAVQTVVVEGKLLA